VKKPLGKWVIRMGIAFLALGVIGAALLLWGFFVEPSLLTVTNMELADARLPKEMDGVRAVFFSDLHVGSYYSEADTERVAAKIKQLDPDILLFGGDMTQEEEPEDRPDGKRVSAAFAAIRPRYGKYAIYGNHDIWPSDVKGISREILAKGGFTILENREVKVADGLYVAGTLPWPLHLGQAGKDADNESSPTWAARNGFFTLLLAHEPAQIKDNAKFPFALQLSGHTHGGQVSLPFWGPLAQTYAMDGYCSGRYKVNDTTLYVTRGVGVVSMRVRLFAPPEIVVVTLRCK
jgi:uncharacterized protein